ncbi:MAG: apolipoprotein N-acyltransferase, partial [Prochlorococcaceae cyanobacterium]
NNRWLVSVANTGPSGLISPQGSITRLLPASRPAMELLSVAIRSRLTPYGRWGELPLIVLALLLACWRWRLASSQAGTTW